MNASSSFLHPLRRPCNVQLYGCGLDGPSASELRTPAQGLGFTGGMNRCGPVVLTAYGIPLKAQMPLRVNPLTFPFVVSTIVFDEEADTAPGDAVGAGVATALASAGSHFVTAAPPANVTALFIHVRLVETGW
jgi:hypothetical protein